MTDLEVGMFSVDPDTRTVRGILVPWNETSRVSSTKNKPVKFPPGAVRVPRDVSIVGLNRQHDRYDPFGRARRIDPTYERGLYAEFTIADTEEGDAWLADHGDLVRLSPELRDIIRDADGVTATATLTGAALVDAGAFASAGLFAIDEDEKTPDEESDTDEPTGEPETAEDSADTQEEEVTEEVATVPGTLPTRQPAKKNELTRRGLFAMFDAVMGGRATPEQRRQVQDLIPGEAGLFALNDVDYDGTGGVGAGMSPTAWIGEVEDGTTYQQTFVPLFGSKNLTGLAMSGWKWGVKPVGATWAGNKAAISSNTPTIVPVSENATRWAGGHDIAREHRDFGTPGFFESYNAAMRESFDKWLDETIVLTEALAGATDVTADNPSGLSIGAGLSALIDGASEIVEAGLIPTAAVVETSVWKQIAKTPSSDTLGYLSAALGLRDGQLDGFRIVPSSLVTDGHVLVVSRGAADVYTLPGSPIRAEALNIANGGIDIGFFGYGGFQIKNAAGIVDVAPYVAG